MIITLSPVLQRTLLYTLGLLIMKSVSLVMVPIITRHLPLAEYGILEILIASANLGTVILGFGLTDALFRFAGNTEDEHAKQRVCANTVALALLIGVVVGLLLQLAAPFIRQLLPGPVSITQVRLVLFSLSLEGCIAVPLAWLRMGDQVRLFLWFSCSKALIQAFLTVVVLSLGFGVTGILASGAVSALGLAVALLHVQWRQTGIHLQPAMARPLIGYGAPLTVAGLAAFVMGGLDSWLVADSVGGEALASYAIDRRCLRKASEAVSDNNVEALICFFCAFMFLTMD